MEDHSTGFQRWLAKRAAAPKTTTDEDYEAFTAAMRGPGPDANGRASHGVPGGEDPAADVPDHVVYAGYLAELNGTAARRRSEQNARLERIEREDEIVRHARIAGGGLSRSHEHLRARIPGAGRPGEGS